MLSRNFLIELLETGQLRVDENGHLILFNEFGILTPSGVVVKLRELLERQFGEKVADKILMKLGEYQVEAAAKRYIKILGIHRLDKNKIIQFTEKILNVLGWGKILVQPFHDSIVTVIMKESALGIRYRKMYKKNSKRPIDFWVAGMLKKHFSVIFETEVKVKETKCMAMGHPYCEFLIKKVKP
ncbi:MAG: 4-vinyl reductase [Candidatus Aenigmatarchaeota archaeon]|nr:4-vinyl reductase [Candidatus Aenigmarchaeota archaeon]